MRQGSGTVCFKIFSKSARNFGSSQLRFRECQSNLPNPLEMVSLRILPNKATYALASTGRFLYSSCHLSKRSMSERIDPGAGTSTGTS